eukprot:scaffold220146_cov22-Prasinocladus_malaysianus.AAC.1
MAGLSQGLELWGLPVRVNGLSGLDIAKLNREATGVQEQRVSTLGQGEVKGECLVPLAVTNVS